MMAASSHDVAAAIARGTASRLARVSPTESLLTAGSDFSDGLTNDMLTPLSEDLAARTVASAPCPSAGDDDFL
jgi:hypothetical protein